MKIIFFINLLIICAVFNLSEGIYAQQKTERTSVEIISTLALPTYKCIIYNALDKSTFSDTIYLTKNVAQKIPVQGDFPMILGIKSKAPYRDMLIVLEKEGAHMTIGDEVMVLAGKLQANWKVFKEKQETKQATWQQIGQQYTSEKNLDEKIIVTKQLNAIASEVETMNFNYVQLNANNITGAWEAQEYAYAWSINKLDSLIVIFSQQPWAKKIHSTLLNERSKRNSGLETGQKNSLDFPITSLSNQLVQLKEVTKGHRYVLIDFWASWCVPCRAANRELAAHYAKIKEKEVLIISISVDKDQLDWKKAIAADQLPWMQFITDNAMESSIIKSFKIESLPATFLLDQENRLIKKNISIAELESL